MFTTKDAGKNQGDMTNIKEVIDENDSSGSPGSDLRN
jgi:hypothetical protein